VKIARIQQMRSADFFPPKRIVAYSLMLTSLLFANTVLAFEFISLAKTAILYDAPSQMAKKLYVGTRYLPLEQIVSVDGWSKVRDSSGAMFWVEKSAIGKQRFVVVSAPFATIRSAAEINSTVVFHAQQNVALEHLEADGTGWVKVRHLEGAIGFVKVSEVWGE
jgi:SH3-like domain-containing protein